MENVVSAPSRDVGTLSAPVQQWSELLAQVQADETLKRRFVDTPLAVLRERGIEVPAGMEIRVVENTDKVSYLTLPAKGSQGELTSDELTQVSGGNPVAVAVGILAGYGAYTLGKDIGEEIINATKTGTLKGIKKPVTPPK